MADLERPVLLQNYRRHVPGRDAFVERVLVLHPLFTITHVRARGLVVDYGLQAELVDYIPRLAEIGRSQLSLLLSGRGYFARRPASPGDPPRIVMLEPGDLVESEQGILEPEGYAGDPLEVLIIAWEADACFGAPVVGRTSFSRIGRADVDALRRHVATLDEGVPSAWATGLVDRLRALGLAASRDVPAGRSEPDSPLARVSAWLALALGRLDTQPSLSELAEACELTERHSHRILRRLETDYRYPYSGWRGLVQDSRLAWATSLLSVPGTTVGEVARVAGYRSATALVHAFTSRCGHTPGALRRRLDQRWG